MYDITSKFYGTAGPEFINRVIKEYAENDFRDLKNLYNEIMSNIEEKTDNDVLSYISSVSIVTLADILIGRWFFKEDEKMSYDMAEFILKNLDNSKDIDIVEKAYEYITSWLISNHKSFDLYKDPKTTHLKGGKLIEKLNPENDLVENERTKKSFGIYDKGVYYVHRAILEDKLDAKNYSYRKIVMEFAKRGYIIPTRDKQGNIKTTTVEKKCRDINSRMFAFPVEVINQFLEGKELEDAQKELIATVNMCDSYEEFEARQALKLEDLLKNDDTEDDEKINQEIQKEIEELEKLDKI